MLYSPVKLIYSMVRIKSLSYFLFLVLLTSCGRFSEITVGEIHGVTIKGFEENSLVVTFYIPIENPTLHRITISDFDTRLFMNSQYVGKISSADVIVLPSRSNMVHEITMHVRLANFLGMAIGIMNLKKGQNVNFRIEGTVSARTVLVKRKIEIDEVRNVTI